jgi:UDP-N-acetylglucosamine 1-carboxyvinyltransferase
LETFAIEGGIPLSGELRVQGAKNAALPILAATVLAGGSHIIHDVPHLLDIKVMLEILSSLGAKASHNEKTVNIDTTNMNSSHVPRDLMGRMRSSIFLMGPLLGRFGEVTLSPPGGCAIGERRIDFHLKGLQALGVEIAEEDGLIYCRGSHLKGSQIFLDFPSVGATENIMMAAVKAEGTTTIHNAAREPEIIDLQNFLNVLGAKIVGAGTETITIEGVSNLVATEYTIIPDRIVAGTMLLSSLITGGSVTLTNVNPSHMMALIDAVQQCGVEIEFDHDIIKASSNKPWQCTHQILTSPYPGFPTDMQAQMMSFLSLAEGCSMLQETIFDARFKHVNALNRLGADIFVDYNTAFIRGVPRLYGDVVEATDLRAGAALVLAGLAAEGQTIVKEIYHIDRGYDKIDDQLTCLGARIQRIELPD